MPPDKTKALSVAPMQDPLAKVKEVHDLCQELFSKRDAHIAKRIAFEAGELAAFYSSIRSNAEQVVDSAYALASLRTMVPPPSEPPAPEAAPQPAEEAKLQSPLAGREEAEEAFRLSSLGLTKPATATPPEKETGGARDPNQFDLGVFFSNVSRSVVDAQRELDVASMQYSREQANSPVPPAFYSIPTVHAEIKAGLSSADGNGILVKLISDQSQSSFTESTISFDIVSSSPPPGALGKFTAAVPRFLAVEGADWQHVMDALTGLQPAGPLASEGWQQRTIIVRDLDPVLKKLNQSVMLAFVFGPIPAAPEGSPTDYSTVPLSIYKLSGDGDPALVPEAGMTAEVVRAIYTEAFWLTSTTVR